MLDLTNTANLGNRLPNGNSVGSHRTSIHKPFICWYPECFSSYNIKGDLARHQREKHSSHEYRCPLVNCPRSIEGEGFARNDHLVKHLVSKKQGLCKQQAEFEARKKNGRNSKAMGKK